MDTLSHAVAGAAIAGVGLGCWQNPSTKLWTGRRALLYGALLGNLPDLDVLIRQADPIAFMTSHRGFTHSIFVLAALAALLTAILLRRRSEAPVSAQRLFITLWLVLISHPVLDAFTVYGTQLFWPLPLTPASWGSVFIIDPLLTLPLLIAVVLAFRIGGHRAHSLLKSALFFGAFYLGLSLVGRFHHEHRVAETLAARGIAITAIKATPMPFNTVLWRVIAKTKEGDYIEAISGWFDATPPEMVRQPLDSAGAADLLARESPSYQRLVWFTDGWLRHDIRGNQRIVSDLRMGVAGKYNFRFALAEQDPQGAWHWITPRRDWKPPGGQAELKQMWERLFDSRKSLPLETWVKEG